jgi:hypothetical protein
MSFSIIAVISIQIKLEAQTISGYRLLMREWTEEGVFVEGLRS